MTISSAVFYLYHLCVLYVTYFPSSWFFKLTSSLRRVGNWILCMREYMCTIIIITTKSLAMTMISMDAKLLNRFLFIKYFYCITFKLQQIGINMVQWCKNHKSLQSCYFLCLIFTIHIMVLLSHNQFVILWIIAYSQLYYHIRYITKFRAQR